MLETADTIARHKNKENEIASYMMEKIKEYFTKEEYHVFIKKYIQNEIFEEVASDMQQGMQDEMNYRMSHI